jgi:hypothetical protein
MEKYVKLEYSYFNKFENKFLLYESHDDQVKEISDNYEDILHNPAFKIRFVGVPPIWMLLRLGLVAPKTRSADGRT